jgi:hypothetical protein
MSRPSYPAWFNFITMFDVEYVLICVSSCYFLSLRSIQFFRTLFWDTLNLHSSLRVWDQVSRPYKTRGKNIFFYILIFRFLHWTVRYKILKCVLTLQCAVASTRYRGHVVTLPTFPGWRNSWLPACLKWRQPCAHARQTFSGDVLEASWPAASLLRNTGRIWG